MFQDRLECRCLVSPCAALWFRFAPLDVGACSFFFLVVVGFTIPPIFLPKFIVETDSTRLDLSGLTLTKKATFESPEISSWRHSVLYRHKIPTRCIVLARSESANPACSRRGIQRPKAHNSTDLCHNNGPSFAATKSLTVSSFCRVYAWTLRAS